MKPFVLAIALVVFTYSAQAGNKAKISAGKAKAVTCVACHGANGISSNDMWPNLAGQKVGYLVKQMKDFSSGVRKEPIMAASIQVLSEKDFENVARYYNSLKK